MTKTINFKKVTAMLMAVVMMFATLGVTAFAEGNISLSSTGSTGNLTIKIMYDDCDGSGKTSSPAGFNIATKRTCNLRFTTGVPSATIFFYRNGATRPCASFTTPTYVSGMPSTLSTSVTLEKGDYTVGVISAKNGYRASGYFEIGPVSGFNVE